MSGREPLMMEHVIVSMKSGLEGRNNMATKIEETGFADFVSMKSGLEGRNNMRPSAADITRTVWSQ